jgi:hypothetical protein
MAWTYGQSLAASWEESQIDQRRALADIDEAHLNEDWSALQAAKNRLRDAEQHAAWISRKANMLHDQQQAAQARPASKYGLRSDEDQIALSLPNRPDLPKLTDDQKRQIYLYNKNKLAAMRRAGTYDDTQGRVFKGSY